MARVISKLKTASMFVLPITFRVFVGYILDRSEKKK